MFVSDAGWYGICQNGWVSGGRFQYLDFGYVKIEYTMAV